MEDAATLGALLDHLNAFWDHYQAAYLRYLRSTVGDGPVVEACNACVAEVFQLADASFGLPASASEAMKEDRLATLRTISRGRPLLGLFEASRLDIQDRTVLIPLAADLAAKLDGIGASAKAGRIHALLELEAQAAALDAGAKVASALAHMSVLSSGATKSAGEIGALVDLVLGKLAPEANLGADPKVEQAKAKAALDLQLGSQAKDVASAGSANGSAGSKHGATGGFGGGGALGLGGIGGVDLVPTDGATKSAAEIPVRTKKQPETAKDEPAPSFSWQEQASKRQAAAVTAHAQAIRDWVASAVLVDDGIVLPMETVHYESSFATCDAEGKGC